MKRPSVLVVVIALVTPTLLAQPSVVTVSPPANSTAASSTGQILVTFSEPMDIASFDGTTVQVFGRWSGVMDGAFSSDGTGTVVTFVPQGAFSAGEAVSVTLTPGIQSAGGMSLGTTYTHRHWVAAAPGVFQFNLVATLDVRQPGEGLITSYGAYAGDLDNDGYPDLSIPNEASSDVRVFMNDGDGQYTSGFTIHPLPNNSVPSASEGADFNGDGWTDMVTANIAGDSVSVLMNDGAGAFLPAATYSVGNSPRGVVVLDADSDGDADVMTANRSSGNLSLLLNDGTGGFLPAINFQGGVLNETSIVAGDANGDGITDVFVGGYASQDVALLLGDGAGNFTVSSVTSAGGRPWMLAAGDVDNDGFADVVACLSNTGEASVIRSNGAGNLLPAQTYDAGSFTLAIDLGDLDGDGDLDMVASNYSTGNYHVYPNLGAGVFGAPTVLPAQIAGSCAIVADLDGDEDAELVGIDEIADKVFVWQTPPLAVAAASDGAALTVNGSGGSPGFFGPPFSLSTSATSSVTISGRPQQPVLLAVGFPATVGTPTLAGTLNLALAPTPPVFLLDGLPGGGPNTDGNGSVSVTFGPSGLPPGLSFGLQAAVLNPANLAVGFTVSNPMTFVISP